MPAFLFLNGAAFQTTRSGVVIALKK
ncbi:MAG: hypothetical protein H6Q26_41, partial [Bacteroidetes bacterium]|nr:hypothetical protein [Bacteroidota bacterium]